MSVGTKFKNKFTKVRTHLTSLDDQPLGKAALLIIIFLDIFILISIFDGLDAHTRQLTSPDAYIPNTCREIVVNRQWNPTNRIDNLSQIIISSSTSPYRDEEKRKERHPVCVPYVDLVDQIKNDIALTSIFEDRNKSEREAKELQRAIDNLKGAYDTSLLETIAKQQESQTKVDATKALEAFVNATTKALKKGDRVALVGFGSFSVSKRAARVGRNPQTGKAIKIAAKKVAKFKAGADLAKTVNK